MDWSRSGTPSAPITVRGYPGEQAVFDGAGFTDKFLWFTGGAGDIVLRDVRVIGYRTAKTGVISMSDGAHDITLQNVEIDGNRGGTTQDHLIYLSAPGVHDITIQGCTLAGISGAAIHVYHEPAATSIRIDGNHIADAHWGVMLYSGTSDVVVTGNRFTDVDVPVRLERATRVSLLDNTANGEVGIQVVGPPMQAQYLDEGNTWPSPVQTAPWARARPATRFGSYSPRRQPLRNRHSPANLLRRPYARWIVG
ncbi:MAG: right-handed parallel beta-helix repeat-containing protein [Chloroflexota bacterium]